MKQFLIFMVICIFCAADKDDALMDQKTIAKLIDQQKHHKVGISIGRYIYTYGVDNAIEELQKTWFSQLIIKYKPNERTNKNIKFSKIPNEKSCFEGKLDTTEIIQFQNRLNFVRAIAGIELVNAVDEDLSLNCQKAAWCLAVNDQITHFIPKTFKCYSLQADLVAKQANLTYGYEPGQAIYGMLRDETEDNYAVGHRRWLLHPALTFPGLGLTDKVMVVQVFGDKTSFREKYADLSEYKERAICWPIAGVHPYFLATSRFSITIDKASFAKARITVFKNQKAISVKILKQETGYGHNTIAFDIGAKPLPTDAFRVKIENVILVNKTIKTFSYSTKFIAI